MDNAEQRSLPIAAPAWPEHCTTVRRHLPFRAGIRDSSAPRNTAGHPAPCQGQVTSAPSNSPLTLRGAGLHPGVVDEELFVELGELLRQLRDFLLGEDRFHRTH